MCTSIVYIEVYVDDLIRIQIELNPSINLNMINGFAQTSLK